MSNYTRDNFFFDFLKFYCLKKRPWEIEKYEPFFPYFFAMLGIGNETKEINEEKTSKQWFRNSIRNVSIFGLKKWVRFIT